ncbi:ELOV4 protein, partial [Menura novaehollandiae]|nr:ELOV4 protein [Menura novaehollandiae]
VFCFPDPRTEPWPHVCSPLAVTLVFASYLSVVALGPCCVRQQRRLELRGLLAAYSLAMMTLSSCSTRKLISISFCLFQFLVTSVLGNYSYLCQPVDYSQSELGMRMARVCWWFFFSKVFFILHKKQEQVTLLHMYHRGSMLFSWWSGVKYVPGGQACFIGMLNSFVHIFMYGYSALASLGPRACRYRWWKRYLTIMQLCQLVAIAAHSSYNLFTECPFPDGFNTAVFLYILSLLALFLHCCYQTYLRGKR